MLVSAWNLALQSYYDLALQSYHGVLTNYLFQGEQEHGG